MSFNGVDDTKDAITAGQLADLTLNDNTDTNWFSDMAAFGVRICKMASKNTSLFRCLFYKKWGMLRMGTGTVARGLRERRPERVMSQEQKLWPGGGKWIVKKRSPLRAVMMAWEVTEEKNGGQWIPSPAIAVG
ncbi:hypothetical protein SBOR_9236 [Sclerotinia borealis F-4128]|uniref:Uncharacterized protein n=1 Tax=Sclerotinia borealis (strain F-4128) TaxID=1432307 RepID=W9C663_SCLBF|nr:hypothetical protein SBOR_9236 [Sclerotinia borealis F-4128]